MLLGRFRSGTQGWPSMTAPGTRHPLNVPGKYWVDCHECLVHELCVHLAPNNFTMIEGEDFNSACVIKQPETPEEERQCREALESCPVAAIRDDGDVD
jgi:ferredoxin